MKNEMQKNTNVLKDEDLDGVTGGALDKKGNFSIVCPACHSKSVTTLKDFGVYGVCRCDDCGNMWQHEWGWQSY